jgi:S-adenosylmethionine:tRNA ribosyltransferase-isomerase
MIAANQPRTVRDSARLLVLDSTTRSFIDARVVDLPTFLREGDLLVVNDAATLPASLKAWSPSGLPVEIRLLSHAEGSDWTVALLGDGDWRIATELRDPPERMTPGAVLRVAGDFFAEVVSLVSNRLALIRFNRAGAEMWTAIYAWGRPVQYSYLKDDLALWSVQTAYASRPWAVEPPSAGLPLTWSILLDLKRHGIGLRWLTHATGLSAIGDEEVDSMLPLRECFDLPQPTIAAIAATHNSTGRVIAAGTSVVRALEGCYEANGGHLLAGPGTTDLIIDRKFRRHVVDGILTGVHDPAQSHFRLLHAFADETLLRGAWRHATKAGYQCHEFGDLCLILPV